MFNLKFIRDALKIIVIFNMFLMFNFKWALDAGNCKLKVKKYI